MDASQTGGVRDDPVQDVSLIPPVPLPSAFLAAALPERAPIHPLGTVHFAVIVDWVPLETRALVVHRARGNERRPDGTSRFISGPRHNTRVAPCPPSVIRCREAIDQMMVLVMVLVMALALALVIVIVLSSDALLAAYAPSELRGRPAGTLRRMV